MCCCQNESAAATVFPSLAGPVVRGPRKDVGKERLASAAAEDEQVCALLAVVADSGDVDGDANWASSLERGCHVLLSDIAQRIRKGLVTVTLWRVFPPSCTGTRQALCAAP